MNETIRTLLERRSIRKFKPEQIKEDELNAILEAGMYTPSGANQQSALFVVVQDKDTLYLLRNKSFSLKEDFAGQARSFLLGS